MQSRKAPNEEQKRFHNAVAGYGCYVTGEPACIHHCVGSTGRHNKVDIGQWWVIPLSPAAHQGQHGIHGDRLLFSKKLGERRQDIEKNIFSTVVTLLDYELPPKVYEAIMDYKR